MQSSGYTQVNHAFGKPSIKNDFTDKFNAKTLPMIVATTDQEGISGKLFFLRSNVEFFRAYTGYDAEVI